MKKSHLLVTLLMVVSLVATLGAGGAKESSLPTIGVSKILTHAALDAVEEGLQDYLAEANIEVKFDFQNANGDVSTANSIAQKFKADRVDIAIGIATPVAQALANTFHDIPVIFAAVTDPIDAALVDTYTTPYAGNVTGVSDMNPVEAQIALLIELTGAKRIGNIYASGEANGVILMEQAKAACAALGVEFVTSAVANTAEVKQATQSIVKRVDAMYIATDNTVMSAIPAVAEVCSNEKVALMTGDSSGLEGLDFLVSWGFNYKIGQATGKIVKELLIDGKKPGEIGTIFLTEPRDFELWFNLDMAKKLGIQIPQDLLATAAVIINQGQKIVQ